MNNQPIITINLPPESESESSSSVEEVNFQGQSTEIEKIGALHKELQKKIAYQMMQYKNTTRTALSEIPAPVPVGNENPSMISLESSDSKPQNIQDFIKVISNFHISQKELAITKDTISKIEEESHHLYEKLKNLEEKIAEKRSQVVTDSSNCSCIIA